MNKTAFALLLLALLIGCAGGPPHPHTDQRSEEHLSWYAVKAMDWFEETGSREALLKGRTIDRSRPVEEELSADSAAVIIHLPLSTESDRQHFVRIVLDVHTGEVRNWFYVERYTIPSLLKPPAAETLIL